MTKYKISDNLECMKNAVVYVLILVAVLALVFVLISSKNKSTVKTPTPTGISSNIADINRDGRVDAVDKNFITSSMNCAKNASCWNKVVGKTSDGDNPIYASDLDLNHDGLVDQSDLNLIK